MELQNIRRNRQAARRRRIEFTSLEQEIEVDRESWLERANTHLEKLLAKANKDKDMLMHMKNHYWARNHVCNAKIKTLKARLRKALKRRKGMIGSKSWLRLPWLNMILNDRPPAQISRNLEKILSILNFLALKQVFLPNV